MICNQCKNEFTQKHLNQKLCSSVCKSLSRKEVNKRYKKTGKGRTSELKWRKSEALKITEQRYRSKPETKKIAYLRKKKYEDTENGKITKLNSDHRRRMMKKSGKVTAKEWAEKLKEYDYKCANCGTDENIQMDHVYPLSKGGAHNIDNIQPLCGSCNSSKGAKLEWVG